MSYIYYYSWKYYKTLYLGNITENIHLKKKKYYPIDSQYLNINRYLGISGNIQETTRESKLRLL